MQEEKKGKRKEMSLWRDNRANNEQGKRGKWNAEMSNFYGNDHDDGENSDSLQCRASLTGGGGRGRCLQYQVMLGLPQSTSFAPKLSLSSSLPFGIVLLLLARDFCQFSTLFHHVSGARAHSPILLCNVGERSHD